MRSKLNYEEQYIRNDAEYREAYESNMEHIDENGGRVLTQEQKHILLAGFVSELHNLISTVACETCNLSKSTYDAEVYIREIESYQSRITRECIRDDMFEIIDKCSFILEIIAHQSH